MMQLAARLVPWQNDWIRTSRRQQSVRRLHLSTTSSKATVTPLSETRLSTGSREIHSAFRRGTSTSILLGLGMYICIVSTTSLCCKHWDSIARMARIQSPLSQNSKREISVDYSGIVCTAMMTASAVLYELTVWLVPAAPVARRGS